MAEFSQTGNLMLTFTPKMEAALSFETLMDLY